MELVGLTKLSADTIEKFATNQLMDFDKRIFESPNPSCVVKFASSLVKRELEDTKYHLNGKKTYN